MEESLERLRDEVARQDSTSHVDPHAVPAGAGPAARTLFAWAHCLVRRNTLAAFGLLAGALATGPVQRVYSSKPPPALPRGALGAPEEPGLIREQGARSYGTCVRLLHARSLGFFSVYLIAS